MTTGMPELGSKISLISKADIRYEGRLYTVDPQECTIALSNVRSFGTEDRETQFQIAPQNQIYDYILFRGTDIKDIRVVNNNLPHPNDPAIMQVQLPNGQHIMPHFPMPGMNSSHPPGISSSGVFGNPFGAMGGSLGGLGNASNNTASSSLAPSSSVPTVSGAFLMAGNNSQPTTQQIIQQKQQPIQQQQQQQKQPISVMDMLTGASRSTTPISLLSRKSQSGELVGMPMGNGTVGLVNQQIQQQHKLNLNQGNAGSHNMRDVSHKRQINQQQLQRGSSNNRKNTDFYHQQHQSGVGRSNDGRMENYNHYHDGRNNYNPRNTHSNQNRNWTMHRNGPNNMNANMRNRGLIGNRGRLQSQGYRSMGVPSNQNKPRTKNTIKFEQDFDFEQANNKFEELRSQLSKLKVADEPKTEQQSVKLNGETDKKDDSGNETGAGEHEHEEEEITVGYDKTKSFFDNISCEAAQDRSKNKKNDWRQERKLNSETFGVSSTRRGSYRGRQSFYNNRNVNNYMAGGYNRAYRGGNFRNRSNNRMNNMVVNRDNHNVTSANETSPKNAKATVTAESLANNTSSTVIAPTVTTKPTTLQENLVSPLIATVGTSQ